MKKSLLLVGIMLIPWISLAQTDAENLEKYWKLRNRFREKYVKIGNLQGESLPAWAIKPTVCVDNLDYNEDGTGYSESVYGEMHWGDGMIHQGYYLGLLATEYRLLKNAGQDVTDVLNELFFALEAINRVDKEAEPALGEIYNVTQPQNINGFYIREDVREDFATDHWSNENFAARCTGLTTKDRRQV